MGALYGFSGPVDPPLAEAMDRVLAHRGGKQRFEDATPQGTLACRPWAPAASGGLAAEGDQALALAGEVYEGPAGQGTRAEALLAAYSQRGLAFIPSLKGAYILAIRDGEAFHLVRDGAGARTVYWAVADGRLLFAVEPKGILADPTFPRRIRPAAPAQYLTYSFIPGRRTMLKGLEELPAGHVLSWRPGRAPELDCHFPFERIPPQNSLPESAWVDRFREAFSQATARRLPQGEPPALFLSGGIDSSIAAVEVARQSPVKVDSYAIHFGPDYPNELDFARQAAQWAGTRHHEVLIEPKDFLPRLRRIIWHMDDPIGDPITVPNFELAALASRSSRHVFNGEGGDPVFGGPKNIPMLLSHWYGRPDQEPGFREHCYLASYRRCHDDLSNLLTPEWRAQYDQEAALSAVLTPFFQAAHPPHFLNKLMAINIRLKGAHLILPKVERMLGAWGVRPLSPLFDEDLIALSFQMPPTMKLNRGVEKYVLKRAFEGRLPESVIQRPKSGMRVPVHFWFQKEMKRYARKILSPKRIKAAGIFNPDRVKQLLAYDIEEGPGRYGLRLWMLITFEIWRRMVVEGEPL